MKKKEYQQTTPFKAFVEWFQAVINMLWPLCYAPSLLGHATKQKSAKYTLKLPNQITIKHACRRGLRSLTF